MLTQTRGYSDEPQPLAAYAVVTTAYGVAVATATLGVRRLGRSVPDTVGTRDLLLLAVATYKLSRLATKDWVTSFLRAPFTRYEGPASQSEVKESPRGDGLQRAIGQLVT